MDGTSGKGKRAIRSAFEQWAAARAFPRGQHDLPREGHPRKDAGHFCGDFSGAGSRTRRPERHVVVAHFALWTGSSARIGHGPGQRAGTLYADEFHREPGESPDQQHHRSIDSHARLQGSQCSHGNFARHRRKSAAACKPSLRPSHSATRRRGRAKMEAPELSLPGKSARSNPAEIRKKERESWPSQSLYSYLPAIRAKSCAHDWTEHRSNTQTHCSPRTKFCKDYTIPECSNYYAAC